MRRREYGRGPQFDAPRTCRFAAEELLVGASFHDAATVQHYDFVAIPNGAHAVR